MADDLSGETLTERQSEILRYITLGYTNKEIGRFVNISPNTVKAHTIAIYRKINVSNRAEAAGIFNALFINRGRRSSGTAWKLTERHEDGKPIVVVVKFDCNLTNPLVAAATGALSYDVATNLSLFRWFEVFPLSTVPGGAGSTPDNEAFLSRRVHVITGIVTPGGRGKLRIPVRVSTLNDEKVLWARHFETGESVFLSGNADLGRKIAAVAAPEIVSLESAKHSDNDPKKRGCWNDTMQGLHLIGQRDRKSVEKADFLFARALSKKRSCIPALFGRALAHYMFLLENWSEEPGTCVGIIHECAALCLKYGRNDPSSYFALAIAKVTAGEIEQAIHHLRTTLDLNPCLVQGYLFLGQLMALVDRIDEGISCLNTALALSPMSPSAGVSSAGIALLQFVAGRYEEAIRSARNCSDYGYCNQLAVAIQISAYARMDMKQMAAETFRQARDLIPDFDFSPIRTILGSIHPKHRTLFFEGLKMAGVSITEMG